MRIFLLLISCFTLFQLHAQDSLSYLEQMRQHREELNQEFADSATSPLQEEDRMGFEALDFFPVDSNFRVVAQVVLTPDEKPFEMPTSTDRKPMYRKYGEAHFELNGEKFSLSLFQNLSLIRNPLYKGYLFVPFNDLTNGFETYGGGRYLDQRLPQGDTIIIDFNKAYNPYCAYNYKYSCPIPPRENHLEVKITAGVKDFDEK